MELRQLRSFKAVAEQLSFSRASEKLHLAQSALSRQIQSLEHALGVQLFERSRSGISLTDAGKAFYLQVCKLLLQVDVAVTEARQVARGSSGELVICTDWRHDARAVSEAVAEFRARHPRVAVTLRETPGSEQLPMVRSGKAHLGFVAREFIGRSPELQFLPTRRAYVNVLLPKQHRLATRQLVRIAELAKETWIDNSEPEAASFRAYFMQQCRLSGMRMRIGQTAETVDSMFGHIASGFGISAAPDRILPPPGLPITCIRTDCPPIEFGAVWHFNNHSVLLRDFLAVLRTQIGSP